MCLKNFYISNNADSKERLHTFQKMDSGHEICILTNEYAWTTANESREEHVAIRKRLTSPCVPVIRQSSPVTPPSWSQLRRAVPHANDRIVLTQSGAISVGSLCFHGQLAWQGEHTASQRLKNDRKNILNTTVDLIYSIPRVNESILFNG